MAKPRPSGPEALMAWVDMVNRTMEREHLVGPEAGGLRFEMPIAEAPGWRVSWLVVERDGERLLADLRVFAGAPVRSGGRVGTWDPTYPVPAPGVTAKLLRLVSVAELSELAGAAIYDRANPGASEDVSQSLKDVATKLSPTSTARRTGRKGTPDEDYLVFAQLYHQAKARPSKTPVRDVANQLGWATRDKVRDLIHQCRVRGLLTADGRLTNYALELAAGQAKRTDKTGEKK